MGKNISKNISGKYIVTSASKVALKFFDSAIKSGEIKVSIDAFKTTTKRVIKKNSESNW